MNDSFTVDGAEINKAKQAEEVAWQMAICYDTLESYRHYMASYPQGLHVPEAQHLIDDMEYAQKERIIRELCEDRNAYSLRYLKAMGFTPDDLMGILRDSRGQVRNEVLNSWGKELSRPHYEEMLESIPTGTAEVYFWGIPNIGQTCLIAAILNAAKRMKVYYPRSEGNMNYMNELASVFYADPAAPALPLAEPTLPFIQSLPLSLIEYKGKKQIEHKLSIISFSGQMIYDFLKELGQEPFYDKACEKLKTWLSSNVNPKYHFFIVEAKSGLENRQQQHLHFAVSYFKQIGIFNKTTKGISVIVTKCDELSPDSSEWPRLATEYIKNCYPAMVNELQQIVGPKRQGGLGINDGSIQVIPFSIGDVFLQKLCLFNPEPAERMVKILMECTLTRKD